MAQELAKAHNARKSCRYKKKFIGLLVYKVHFVLVKNLIKLIEFVDKQADVIVVTLIYKCPVFGFVFMS